MLLLSIGAGTPYRIVFGAILVGSLIYSLHFATLQRSDLARLALERTDATIRATVIADAKTTTHKVNGSILRKPQQSFLVRAKWVETDETNFYMRLPVRVLSSSNETFIPGDEIRISGRIIATKEKRVAATLIGDSKIEVIQPAGYLAQKLAAIRDEYRKLARQLDSTAASLIPGMILGDTSLQSEEFSRQMRRSGLSHLTAVSGANFAIVSALVLWLMRFVSRRVTVQVVATSIFLTLFLLLVRPSPSVLRAGVMAAVILFARASGNRRNAVSALATAITVLLLLDPFQSQDPGFVLSVLATSGLIFLAPDLTEKLRLYLPSFLAEVVAVSISATVLCTPYIMFLSGEISVLSILFNILVSPLIAPITIIGFMAVLLLPIPELSTVLLVVAEHLSGWVVFISELSGFTPSWRLNPLYLIFLILISTFLNRNYKALFMGLIILLGVVNLLPRISFPGADWKVAQCDVGQGDALVLNLGNHAAALFDVGPDPTLIDRCLKVLKIKSLPLIVLSHNHADHTFGLSGATKNRELGEIWSNGNVRLDPKHQNLERIVRQGDLAQIGIYKLEVLWPQNSFSSDTVLPGDGSKENNSSLVVLVTLEAIAKDPVFILITGDIEPEAQIQILRGVNFPKIDILKVAHHGSRFQSDEFVQETAPKIALVSVGRDNSYGHPDLGILRELTELGSTVRRTDLDGPISVAWRFDEAGKRYIFTTRSMRKEWWRIQWL